MKAHPRTLLPAVPPRGRRDHAFTLLEILVATITLLLLVVLLGSMFNSSLGAWKQSRDTMDNFTKGRALINIIANDMGTAVVRQDLPAFAGGQLAFYTRQFRETNVTQDMRALTWVAYTTDTNQALLCATYPCTYSVTMSWAQTPFLAGGSAPSFPTQPVTHVLCGSGVYGFAWSLIARSGSQSQILAFNNPTIANSDPTVAARVSLAILSPVADQQLRLMGAGKQNQLATTMAQYNSKAAWDTLILSGSMASLFPAAVLGGLRTYERVVPLNIPRAFVYPIANAQ